MAQINIKQGENKKVVLTVLKDGVLLDVTACTNVKALIKINGVVQAKYAKTTEAGFGKLTLGPTPTNLVTLFIERSESKTFTPGIFQVVVLCAFTDSDYPSTDRVEEYSFTPGRIDIGEGVDETI